MSLGLEEIGIMLAMAGAAVGAYWLIRRAVRDGIRDSDQRRSDGREVTRPPTS